VADPAVAEAPETKKSTKAPPPQREGAGRDRKAVVRLEVEGAKQTEDIEIFEVPPFYSSSDEWTAEWTARRPFPSGHGLDGCDCPAWLSLCPFALFRRVLEQR